MFKIIVMVLSLQGEVMGIAVQQGPGVTQDVCTANMLTVTEQVMKPFEGQKATSETKCVPAADAEAFEATLGDEKPGHGI